MPLYRLLLLACLLPLACGAQAPVRTLFLVGGGYHDYDAEPALVARSLANAVASRRPLDIVISKDLGQLAPEAIRRYGLLILNTCEQTELSAEQKKGILEAVRGGTPLAALHCTFAAFQKFPEFHEMLGGFVLKHAPFGPMCVEVVDPEHPITRGLPARFEFPDEPYFVERRDPEARVLVRTCRTYPGREGTEPHVWTKTYGQGRIFAMTFGHDAKSLLDANVQRLLERGVLWALGSPL